MKWILINVFLLFFINIVNLDLQMVDIQVAVMYKHNIDKLPDIYRKLGMDYAERVLPSIATEVAKSVVVCIFN